MQSKQKVTSNIDDMEDPGLGGRRQARPQAKKKPVPDPEGPSIKRQKRSAAPRRQSYTLKDFILDYRTRLGLGIILCFVGIVTAICCISFIFTGHLDQSVITGRSINDAVAANDTAQNVMGLIGAYLGKILMVDSLGIGSIVLAIYVFLLGLWSAGLKSMRFFTTTARCLFTAIALSVIAGLLTYNRVAYFPMGGIHGFYMNKLLIDYSSILGAYAVTVLMAGLLVAVYLNPIKRISLKIASLMPKRAPKPIPVPEENPAEATQPQTESLLDQIENQSEQESETPAEQADETDSTLHIPEEHLRFVPEPVLEDLEPGENNEPESDNENEPAIAPVEGTDPAPEPESDPHSRTEAEPEEEIVSRPENNTEPQDATLQELHTPGEPDMIIVQPDPAKEEEAVDPSAPIRNGDHLGINTIYDPRASHSNYIFPSPDLLTERDTSTDYNEEEQKANKALIVNTLRSYNIEITRIEATIGPTVTLYEIVPAEGTRIAKIKSLEDDIAMSLSALGIRIIAPIPGKGTIGIEVPNRKKKVVPMRSMITSRKFIESKMNLPVALGSTISNDTYITDLSKMPHLLVAGATGQGKSVGLNCIITSLLYSKHPDELKFVLIDPKMVEFSLYQRIANQFLAKIPGEERAVITDPAKVVATLNSLCEEMDRRYELLSVAEVRVVEDYNAKFMKRELNPEEGHRYLPYIVIIVDEFADLTMTAGKEVSTPICRIAQKARAVGIHMILATQRPSTDVITGMIKANFPARIAFKVSQGVDSKTILDRPGAQRLIGKGDMLIMVNGNTDRVQCALVETEEVEAICKFIGGQPGFIEPYELPEPPVEGSADNGSADIGNITDEFRQCALFIASQTQASITMMQRKFEIGFNKAGRYMDQMQQLGIVGPPNGAKPRQVLMTPDEVSRIL